MSHGRPNTEGHMDGFLVWPIELERPLIEIVEKSFPFYYVYTSFGMTIWFGIALYTINNLDYTTTCEAQIE